MTETGGYKQLSGEEIAELLAEAWTPIGAYVGAELRNKHDAEDVMQEIGRAITQAASRYDSTRPFLNWAFGVARIQILRHFERCNRERTVFSSGLVDQLADAYGAAGEKPSVRREALQDCLAHLPPRQAEAVRLYYHEGLSQAVIAEKMEMTGTAVGVLIHRARLALKDCIARKLAAETR